MDATRVIPKALYALPLLLFSVNTFSQTVEQVKKDNTYYWGEGVDKTTLLADENALSMLIGSISSHVESSFNMQTTEVSDSKKSNFKQYVNSLVKTYSNATIKNTEILSWGEEPEVHVFRFVKKAEVYKIFAERAAKIKEFVKNALRAEEKYKAADALRYYYWALLLLQSHPDAGSMSMEAGGKTVKLDVYLPKQINTLFDELSFAVTGRQADENLMQYIFGISYKGQPAGSCDYSFFDGRNWSVPVSAKDGQGIAEMVGDSAAHKEIRVKIEYAFENEWKTDTEVNDVLRKVEPVIFKKSYMTVPLAKRQPARAVPRKASVASAPALPVQSVKMADGAPFMTMLERVEQAIRTKNYASVRDCFTDDGYDVFTRLVQYGRAVIIAKPKYSFMEFEDDILARSLPMRFSFSNNRRAFVEDVVFNISQRSGKIRSLSFALPNNVCSDILKYEKWGEYSRVAIIHFIENYKTAYALKRLDYIESIFSDNALIIVGKIVKTCTDAERQIFTSATKLTQYSKEQYVKQLASVFKSNEYVNLKFTDISVKKAGAGGEIYGVQLQQSYFSTSYGDKGYLFLMVDLNKPEEPVIHVRTWQPEKDPDFGLYDISSF
ncbi:MAG: LPP20 family lipoprotein [Prevotellaceae bacterium]|nr:LPP20 family lipoprotein [Prevotellaceae bacterium]